MGWPGADCRRLSKRASAPVELERDHGIRRRPGLRMFIARAIFCVCTVLHTFTNRVHSADVPRRFSTGTEESLHCGTEDEIVLPVLFITGEPQSGSELRPMPGPVQERVREAGLIPRRAGLY